jgi:trans-2,3-dihydro-3-hydroxyanthranilate isomerase
MHAPLPYRIVNTYGDSSFAGNPIAVITEEVEPKLMQCIARQLACTGTVFVRRTGPAAYSARMFSPTFEAPYGGAGSLAAAWAMGEGRWQQTTSGAVVETEYRDGRAWTGQPEPEIETIEEAELVAALGLDTVDAACLGRAAGTTHIVLVTDHAPADFRPERKRLLELATRHGRATIGAFRRVGDGEVHGRVFAPAHGLDEDPANAGGAGVVARLLQARFGAGEELLIREGEEIGRPSRIEVAATATAIRVGGPLFLAAEGILHLH